MTQSRSSSHRRNDYILRYKGKVPENAKLGETSSADGVGNRNVFLEEVSLEMRC